MTFPDDTMSVDENSSRCKQKTLRRNTNSESVTSISSSNSIISNSATASVPDGGYGYVIVFSAFMTMVITDGVACAFGILYADLLKVFQESKSLTSWILSIYNCTSCLFGPLSSALAIKYGCRKMQIIGGMVASLGIFSSAFSTSVGMMCLTYGVVGGFGMSMGYVTSVVMVANYFKRKRALAMGISVCGSGIGTFIFAPLFEHLLHTYNWQGTLIITSAITLNLVVFGALLRPLQVTSRREWLDNLAKFEKMNRNNLETGMFNHGTPEEKRIVSVDRNEQMNHSAPLLPTCTNGEMEMQKVLLSEMVSDAKNPHSALQRKLRETLTMDNNTFDLRQEIENPIIKSESQNIERANGIYRQKTMADQDQNQCYESSSRNEISVGKNMTKFAASDLQYKSCPNLNVGLHLITNDNSDYDVHHCCFIALSIKLSKHIKQFLKLMFDPSILRLPFFILFLISNFILYFWYDLPYVFFFDYAIELGLSHECAAYLISIIGIVSTVGQVLYGIIGDRNIHLVILYSVSLILCGFAVLAIPLVEDYSILCLIAGSIGLLLSANYCLTPVILVEFVGVDKLTNAYGLIMMIQGVANLFGPPVAGKLYDVSGSYYNTYFLGGLFISFSGAIVVAVEITRCVKDKFKKLCRTGRTSDEERDGTLDTTVRLINVPDMHVEIKV